MDPNNFNDDDWGPWVPSDQVNFQMGDYFILDCFGSNSSSRALYCIDGIRDPNTHNTPLKHYNIFSRKWVSGHYWNLQQSGTTVRLLKSAIKPVSIVPETNSNGVVCMRCNAGNKYAVPNRPNGKYLCFECR